ncbi:hypothetical protein AGMMS49975_10320 [Clostridia bacterium]|nr:hypothetical protein AGMMS49975_10320 [Clostridia bacterium]
MSNSVKIPNFNAFTALGDPGCDGLGAEIMTIFGGGLNAAAADSDFSLILGDIVPYGSERFYKSVRNFIRTTAAHEVYALKGNHDKEFYNEYFGDPEYTLCDDNTAIVVLDNSSREFTPNGLELLEKSLTEHKDKNIILAMHIPPPNSVCLNSLGESEWAKITRLFEKTGKSPCYLLCGHVHSYFEADVFGIKLIASGGGGAREEDIEGVSRSGYHRVRFFYDDGNLLYEKLPIRTKPVNYDDKDISENLLKSFTNECVAHIKYKIYAEDALRRGLPNLSKLLSALAESEYYHARNFLYAHGENFEPAAYLKDSLTSETDEAERVYPKLLKLARERNAGLAEYAYSDALAAEKGHRILLENALESGDIEPMSYYTCTSCGKTFTAQGGEKAETCPVCGAPCDKIK